MHKILTSAFILFSAVFAQDYSIGYVVSMSDQMSAYEVCYGDYPNDSLKLVDFNGGLNGGNYVITFIAIQNEG